jgi:hypothetical protein
MKQGKQNKTKRKKKKEKKKEKENMKHETRNKQENRRASNDHSTLKKREWTGSVEWESECPNCLQCPDARPWSHTQSDSLRMIKER